MFHFSVFCVLKFLASPSQRKAKIEKRKRRTQKKYTNVSLIAKKGTERMTDHPPYNTSRCCRSAFFLVVSEKQFLMSNWDIYGVPQTKPLFLFFSRLDLSFCT